MRIWDLHPSILCRQHLLGEHRELHALWVVITEDKKGYSKHPETLRWKGKLKALYNRHELLVQEMERRKYNHRSPLLKSQARGLAKQDILINSIKEQIENLHKKRCDCRI